MWLYLFGLICITQGFLTTETKSNDAPKMHICVSKILECEPYRVQLSFGKGCKEPLYTRVRDLRDACKYVNRFLICMKIAKAYCKRFPSHLGKEMIIYRSLAEELCQRYSHWEIGYIENSACLNEYSDIIEDICAKGVMDMLMEEYENALKINCFFPKELLLCRVESARGRCGDVAGAILLRLLMYEYEYDLACPHITEEFYNAEDVYFAPRTDSYWNAYKPLEKRNKRRASFNLRGITPSIKYQEEMIFETPTLGVDAFPPDSINKDDLSIAKTILGSNANLEMDTSLGIDDIPYDTENLGQDYFHPEVAHFSKADSDSFENEIKLPTYLDSSFSQSPTEFLSSSQQANYYSDLSASQNFGLYEISAGKVKYLGCGAATISWTRNYLLKNIFCSWSDGEASEKHFECSVHIDEACLFGRENSLKKHTDDTIDLAGHRTLRIYLYENEHYSEIATMKVDYFKPSENSFPTSYARSKTNIWFKRSDHKCAVRRIGNPAYNSDDIDAVSREKKEYDVSSISQSHLQQFNEDADLEQSEDLVTDVTMELTTMRNAMKLLREYLRGLAPSPRSSPQSLYRPYKLFRPRIGDMDETNMKELKQKSERNVVKKLNSDKDNDEILKTKDETFLPEHIGDCSKENPYPTTENRDEFDIKPGMLLDLMHIKIEEMKPYEDLAPESLYTAEVKHTFKGKPIDHHTKIKSRETDTHDSEESYVRLKVKINPASKTDTPYTLYEEDFIGTSYKDSANRKDRVRKRWR